MKAFLYAVIWIMLLGCAASGPPASKYDDIKDPHHRYQNDVRLEP